MSQVIICIYSQETKIHTMEGVHISLTYLIPLETLVCPGNNVLQERGVFSSTLAFASPARAQKLRPLSLPQAL